MRKFPIIIFVLFCKLGINAQNLDLTAKQNIDSLDLWEYSFSKSTEKDDKLGTLVLKRKKDVYSEDGLKSISPQITLDIYPIYFADSIKKLELDRIPLLSCCYPICGATIESTVNFVFWATPWSITSALECNGIDYTRKNIELILDHVKKRNYNSIEELLNELPIKQIKNQTE